MSDREPEVIGYVLVDPNTGAMDWDGLIHPTLQDAVREIVRHVYEGQYGYGEQWEKRPTDRDLIGYDVRTVSISPRADSAVLAGLQAEWDQLNGAADE